MMDHMPDMMVVPVVSAGDMTGEGSDHWRKRSEGSCWHEKLPFGSFFERACAGREIGRLLPLSLQGAIG